MISSGSYEIWIYILTVVAILLLIAAIALILLGIIRRNKDKDVADMPQTCEAEGMPANAYGGLPTAQPETPPADMPPIPYDDDGVTEELKEVPVPIAETPGKPKQTVHTEEPEKTVHTEELEKTVHTEELEKTVHTEELEQKVQTEELTDKPDGSFAVVKTVVVSGTNEIIQTDP